MTEPMLELTIKNPTVEALALLVSLCDHHAIQGDTRVKPSVMGGDAITVEVEAGLVYMPEIDWDAMQEDLAGPDA